MDKLHILTDLLRTVKSNKDSQRKIHSAGSVTFYRPTAETMVIDTSQYYPQGQVAILRCRGCQAFFPVWAHLDQHYCRLCYKDVYPVDED